MVYARLEDFHVDYFILATHHRNDDKITFEALKKGIPYVGVVASAKKTGIIKSYLVENGISSEELDNFYSPTGLDLKAQTPEQIALEEFVEMEKPPNLSLLCFLVPQYF